MSRSLFDAAIIIDYIRGNADAHLAVADGQSAGRLETHAVAAAEVVHGALNKADLRLIDSVLRSFEVIAPSEADFADAMRLLRGLRLSHGIGWPDRLIAATASRLDATVITRNDKHFRCVKGLKVVRPY